MAWVPPKGGAWRCERCGREAAVVDGWTRIERFVEGQVEPAQVLDFCALCKLHVEKALRGLAQRAVREGRWA